MVMDFPNSVKACLKCTVKPVLCSHSKIDQIKVLMANGNWMKVKSIAECSHFNLPYAIIGLKKTIFGFLFEWLPKTDFTVK